MKVLTYLILLNLGVCSLGHCAEGEKSIEMKLLAHEYGLLKSNIIFGATFFRKGNECEQKKYLLTVNLFKAYLINEKETVELMQIYGLKKNMLNNTNNPLFWDVLFSKGYKLHKLESPHIALNKSGMVDYVRINEEQYVLSGSPREYYDLQVKNFTVAVEQNETKKDPLLSDEEMLKMLDN